MPEPACPAMLPVVAFCRSNLMSVVSLASMWKTSLALISPSSMTTRLMPISTIVASVCWRCSDSERLVAGTTTLSTVDLSSCAGLSKPRSLRKLGIGRSAVWSTVICGLPREASVLNSHGCSVVRWSLAIPSVTLSSMKRSTVADTFCSSAA